MEQENVVEVQIFYDANADDLPAQVPDVPADEPLNQQPVNEVQNEEQQVENDNIERPVPG